MSEAFTCKAKCDLAEAMLRFRYHYKVEMPKVIHEVMRGLIGTWFQFTPPKTKKQGVNSIRIDLKRNFIDAQWFADNFVAQKTVQEQTRIRKYFKEGDWDQLKSIKNDGGLFQRVDFKPFSKSDIHRNSRGRIAKSTQHIVCTTPESFEAYRREKEDKVGRLKGSMVNAFMYFGGKPPAWIKKNGEGSYRDYSKQEDIQGASATSFVPYGQQVNQRMDTLRRVYAAQTHKLEGQVRVGVLNKAQSAWYGI